MHPKQLEKHMTWLREGFQRDPSQASRDKIASRAGETLDFLENLLLVCTPGTVGLPRPPADAFLCQVLTTLLEKAPTWL